MSDDAARSRVPQHIAVVMDGNGRWAKARMLPRSAGHRAGQRAVREIIEGCLQHGVKALTLFAFSSENWRRPEEEISALMELFLRALDREVESLRQHDVRLIFIGELGSLNSLLRERIARAVQLTAGNHRLTVNIAVNYGGQWDIAHAARALASAVVQGDLKLEDIDQTHVGRQMQLSEQAAVDLFIRTGGEYRISNFLLWQIAYAELYFTDTLWPDFDQACLTQAIHAYANRERRYGRTGEQLAHTP
ncbi:polyprenyl diphosphate synthase [Frateuria aurantia]